jgi:hypothetical protein
MGLVWSPPGSYIRFFHEAILIARRELKMSTQETAAPSERARQFHEKEYVALREELLALSRDQRFFERAAVIGPVIAYSWLATHGDGLREQPTHVMAWWMPVLLMLFLFRRYQRTRREIVRTGTYIAETEKYFAHGPLKGWETHYAGLHKRRRRPLPMGDWIYWAVLLAAWTAVSTAGTYKILVEYVGRVGWR